MSARFVLILSLCMLFSCLLQTTFRPIEVKASNVYPVHNLNTGLNYETIQEAIDAPLTSNGHTISVEEGTYYENVIADKSVSIVAENRTNTIIDGNETGTALRIVRDATNIVGFLIRDSGCWPEACIRLENVSDCSVSANVVENNNKTGSTFVGIFLYSSQRRALHRFLTTKARRAL